MTPYFAYMMERPAYCYLGISKKYCIFAQKFDNRHRNQEPRLLRIKTTHYC